MLQMLKGVDVERYESRTYIISEGDQFSAAKATEFESQSSFPSVRYNLDRRTLPDTSAAL